MFRRSWMEVRSLPRALWVLAASVLINRLGSMVIPLMTLYVSRELHLSVRTAGMVLSAYGIGALLAGPFAGRLSDRVGPVAMMRGSLFSSGVVLCAFPWFTGEVSLMLGTLVLSALSEGYRPASLSVISQMVPAAQRKSAFALIRLAINLGMSVGPMLGAALAMWSFTAVFLVDGITTLLAGVSLVLFFRPVRLTEAEITPPGSPSPAAPASSAQFAVFLGATLLVSLVFLQIDSTVPLYLVNDLGLPSTVYGLAFTLNTLIIVALELWLNAATSHWSHRRTMVLGALLFALGFGGMIAVTGLWTFLASVVIWTFGEMLLFPALNAYVAEISPLQRRGTWMGLFTMSFNAGFAVAPIVGTLVIEQLGSTVLWIGVGVLGVVAAMAYSRVYEPRGAKASG